MAEVLDQQSGDRKAGSPKTGNEPQAASYTGNLYGAAPSQGKAFAGYADEGGASRFFVQAGYEPWEIEWIYSAGLRPCGMEAPDAR